MELALWLGSETGCLSMTRTQYRHTHIPAVDLLELHQGRELLCSAAAQKIELIGNNGWCMREHGKMYNLALAYSPPLFAPHTSFAAWAAGSGAQRKQPTSWSFRSYSISSSSSNQHRTSKNQLHRRERVV